METDKLTHLKDYIAGFAQVAVAFSGGVDSTLLLKVCEDTLGKDRDVEHAQHGILEVLLLSRERL
ncbi:MAG: hypothetical protein P8107_12060, partial [Spirochaetia bacterium]